MDFSEILRDAGHRVRFERTAYHWLPGEETLCIEACYIADEKPAIMPELRKQLSNVYYDTAALPFLYDATIFDALKQMGLLSKLIYGSDYPLLKIGRFRKMVETTSLTAGETADFLGNTAANLLGRLAGEDHNG